MKMSKKKNKPCITEDEIRKVLEETVMNCSSMNKSDWDFCVQTPGIFYWENIYNKGRIGARLNQDSGVCEIYHSIDYQDIVYIIIHPNIRSISWEGNDIKSTLQPYMYKAFVKLSELIKDESAESKVFDTSEIKMEGEKEMENEDNYIKMDGEKDSFEGGAIRYTKKGKGRYDLIPSQQIHDILEYAKLNWDSIVGKDDDFCSIHNVLMSAYPDADDLTYDNYIEIIINIIRYSYIAAAKNPIFNFFMIGFVKMLKELAIHYEMGAEKYGVDNWKKGIPETKGERGGSFRDSGLRHLQQLLDGKTDEPHQIAAIWNFIGAMYVRKHQDNKTDEYVDLKESDIENPSNDEITIDLSHPDLSFGNVCTIATTGNKFIVSFGTGYKNIQTYSLNKDKISVSRSVTYFDGLREESYTISGMNSLNDEHVKIDLSRSFSFEDKNGKSSVTARIYKGFHMESESDPLCIYFRAEHQSYPKLIENKLWDKLYDDAFKDIVTDIRPV